MGRGRESARQRFSSRRTVAPRAVAGCCHRLVSLSLKAPASDGGSGADPGTALQSPAASPGGAPSIRVPRPPGWAPRSGRIASARYGCASQGWPAPGVFPHEGEHRAGKRLAPGVPATQSSGTTESIPRPGCGKERGFPALDGSGSTSSAATPRASWDRRGEAASAHSDRWRTAARPSSSSSR